MRLIVDAVGSLGLGRDHFDELVAAGGAMCWFNELRLASFSFRDHRKVLRRLDPELAALKLQAWHLRTGRPERRWQGLSMRRMEQVLVGSQPPA